MSNFFWQLGYLLGKLLRALLQPSPRVTLPEKKKVPKEEKPEPKRQPLWQNWKFQFSSQLEERVRKELPAKLGYTPTRSQWSVILTKSSNAYVVAGAGSGKTASLIGRVLFLHHYLRVPLEEITVFSFTRASTAEFREKLKKLFDSYGIKVSEKEIRKVVRTFHSKILEFARSAGLIASPQQLFEHLGGGKENRRIYEEIAFSLENFFVPRLNPRQEELLKQVYQRLFERNEHFRKAITALYGYALALKDQLEEPPWTYDERIIALASRRDRIITEAVHDTLSSKYSQLKPFPLSDRYKDYIFHANGYVPELDIYMIFTPKASLLRSRLAKEVLEGPYEGLSLSSSLVVKRRLLLAHSDRKLRFFSSQQEVDLFEQEIEMYRRYKEGREKAAPSFYWRLEGEPAGDSIWNLFYQTGLFIENLGVEVDSLRSHIFQLPEKDRFFAAALIMFWEEFNEELARRGLKRYHHLFSFFSEKRLENFRQVDPAVLRSMRFLLIDEFQDISPEIASWIRGALKYLAKRGEKVSLMVIGDDWQSIYGWRGSDPSFLINFEEEFRTEPPAEKIFLVENFRCPQPIIDIAERVLEPVSCKIAKHGLSQVEAKEKIYFCKFYRAGQEEDEELIEKIVDHLVKEKAKRIFFLTRTNSDLFRFRRLIERLREKYRAEKVEISAFTFHQSKGLEADGCILVGNAGYNTSCPFKNLIYKLAGYPHSYDQAQRDEARRLAYVAITRARKSCFWLIERRKKGVAAELPEPDCEKFLDFF